MTSDYTPLWERFPCSVTVRSRTDLSETYTIARGVARAWDGSYVYDVDTELGGTPFGGDVTTSTLL